MNMAKPPNTVAHDDEMRREPDDDKPLHKDCKIRVTGEPNGSTRQVRVCTDM